MSSGPPGDISDSVSEPEQTFVDDTTTIRSQALETVPVVIPESAERSTVSPTATLEQLLSITKVLNSVVSDQASAATETTKQSSLLSPKWTPVNNMTQSQHEATHDAQVMYERDDGDISESELTEERGMSDSESHCEQDKDVYFTIADGQVYAHDVSTGVYMVNAQEGSWSGKLTQDDQTNEQRNLAIQAFYHLRRAKEIADAQLLKAAARSASDTHVTTATNHGLDNYDSSDEDYDAIQIRDQDRVLRAFIAHIKVSIQNGCVLTLEHTGAHDVDENMDCAHPYCSSDDRCISGDSYYITVTERNSEHWTVRYCVSCFEDMWNGWDLLIGAGLPDPRVYTSAGEVSGLGEAETASHDNPEANVEPEQANVDCSETSNKTSTTHSGDDDSIPARRDSVQPLALTPLWTEGPRSLLASKHAPEPLGATAESPSEQLSNSQPMSKQNPPPESSTGKSRARSSSQDYAAIPRQWKHGSTRFQCLAPLIKAGDSLNAVEKAAMVVWRAASSERQGRGGVEVQESGMDVSHAQELAKLSLEDCVGTDLVVILEDVGARRDL